MASNAKSEDFHEVYEVSEKIGEGVYGRVYRCFNKRSKEECAVKMMCTSEVSEDTIKDEVEICKKLDHRNVVKLIDFYAEGINRFLVFDMIYGGEIIDDIIERNQYSEFDACQCIEQILKGVRYLHKLNIVHRDLKASNILLTDKNKEAVVKIVDFGNAGIYDEREFFVYTGEAYSYYMAPEMGSNRLSRHGVDIWSCGVMLYIMLVGRPPFQGRGQSLLNQMTQRKYSFINNGKNDCLCKDAKDLIDKLLEPNPFRRLSANEALQHPFIQERKTVTSRFHRQNTIEELKKHKAEIQDKWRRAISAVMFKRATSSKVATNIAEGVRSSRPISAAPKLGAVGRSSAVDRSDADKVDLEETSLDADNSALEEAGDRDGSAGMDVGYIPGLNPVTGETNEWYSNALIVILYPFLLIMQFVNFLSFLRRNLSR